MEEDISVDIKEWMSDVKKPRSTSVQDFVQKLSHLKDSIEYSPIPDRTNNPEIQKNQNIGAEIICSCNITNLVQAHGYPVDFTRVPIDQG
jgi:hypothetical protein